MRNKHLGPYRERIIGAAEDRVFEIGVGSGLNLARNPPAIRELVALEPDPKLIGMARQKSAERERVLSFLEASAELIPLEDLASAQWSQPRRCAGSWISAAHSRK